LACAGDDDRELERICASKGRKQEQRMKNAVVREQETIAFIRNAVVPAHGNLRALVADLLENKYHIDNATSIGMSQGSNWKIIDRGTVQTNRHYRRACIAVRAAILGQPVAAAALAVSGVADAALPATLSADLNAAYNHEVNHLQNQLQALHHNPGLFLLNNVIYVTEAGPSGQLNFIFYHHHNNGTYCFLPQGAHMGNVIPLGGANGNRAVYITVPVHHVRIQEFTALMPNLAAIPGDQIVAGAASLMLTARFSGCSLMYCHAGVNMTAIHINPGGPAYGRFYELAQTLRGNLPAPPPVVQVPAFGNANNAGALHVWGCQANEAQPLDYEPTAYHFVVGVFRGGQWEVWVQKHAPINHRSAHWQLS
jgi:hypothetical protein